MKTKIKIAAPKKRNAVARDLLSPKYRQRVEPNKKREQKYRVEKLYDE